jgi:hypothetical protein
MYEVFKLEYRYIRLEAVHLRRFVTETWENACDNAVQREPAQ